MILVTVVGYEVVLRDGIVGLGFNLVNDGLEDGVVPVVRGGSTGVVFHDDVNRSPALFSKKFGSADDVGGHG